MALLQPAYEHVCRCGHGGWMALPAGLHPSYVMIRARLLGVLSRVVKLAKWQKWV